MKILDETWAHPYVLADVFTDVPLAGNQLAVFPTAADIPERLLQSIARELNLAETVFLFPPQRGGAARMRIFTTVEEVPFAGHPTLGTACVLARGAGAAYTGVLLETGRGVIAVDVRRESDDGAVAFGRMRQPLPEVRRWDGDEPGLLAALGGVSLRLPIEVYDNGIPHLFAMLPSVADVLAIVPDFPRLGQLVGRPRINCFAAARPPSTYVTRMFSPFDFVPEDPATGSAAGPLAAHLVRHELLASGVEIAIAQGEKVGRPATLYASATLADGRLTDVCVGGYSCIVGSGELRLPRS